MSDISREQVRTVLEAIGELDHYEVSKASVGMGYPKISTVTDTLVDAVHEEIKNESDGA